MFLIKSNTFSGPRCKLCFGNMWIHGLLTQQKLRRSNVSTSSPGLSPRLKWWSEKPLAEAAEIRVVEYFITWHMMKCLFRRLFPASGSPVCFLQSETNIETKQRHFIMFAWWNSNELLEPLWQPWPAVSPIAILNKEKALGTRLTCRSLTPSKQEGEEEDPSTTSPISLFNISP